MASPTPQLQKNDDRSVKSVAVVGGGVSGLAAAYKLKSHGFSVTLFESEDKAGGKLRSCSQNGLVWDEGANTMTEREAEVRSLINDLGLRERQQFPLSQNKRYIVKNGMPELVPLNPITLIKSNFLSTKSKLKIMLEPLLWKRSDSNPTVLKVSGEYLQGSVGNFFQRHFGQEVVDYLIDPFIAGTSAGDPGSLSLRHAFPEIWHLERKFGSVIVGAVLSKLSGKREGKGEITTSTRKGKHLHGSFSFHGGLQTLTDTLSKELGKDNLKLRAKVLSLAYEEVDSMHKNWSVSYAYSSGKQPSQNQSFDAVIMTAPLSNVKEMKFSKSGDPFPFDFLPKVDYLPLSVIVTSFKKENVKRPLEGFGVLVPSKERHNGLRTLGTLFSSMMFPDRAPQDQYLYTTFVGGSRDRDLARASLNVLLPVVTSDLKKLLGAEGQPVFVKHVYWSDAFPLYGHDHDKVLNAIEKMERDLPGFYYAGNHRGGLSVGKAITSGCKAADLVVSYLSSRDEKMLSCTQ